MSDQRYRFIDRDRGQAFYAASGGVEKLTADLGNLFFANVAPTTAQITARHRDRKPAIAGVSYVGADWRRHAADQLAVDVLLRAAPKTIKIVGGNGYTIMFCTDATGNPVPTIRRIR